MVDRPPLTRALAKYAVASEFHALPGEVQHETVRAVLNWMGVAIAGSREPAVAIAAKTMAVLGSGKAGMIGQNLASDPASAAFVNCIASSILAYDDAHLPSVAHPSGPAVAALFALSQTMPINGQGFLNAVALGIEVQCRVANMLVLPPSTFHTSIYVNGFSAPIGVAAAIGRVLGLDEERMGWALGIAASQASGFRSTHGTMTAHFRPGHATRVGMTAAFLAANGFDCTNDALEAPGGLLDIFAPGADQDRALDGLGERHEMLSNSYKPYPCGIVIHPIIDACLDIHGRLPQSAEIADVELTVNPLVTKLTGKRSPRTPLESHVSVYHWAAVALLDGRAGLAETEMTCIGDPRVAKQRASITATADPTIGKGEARVTVRIAGGGEFQAHVTNARGSLQRPMTDEELRAKFETLAGMRLPAETVAQLAEACGNLVKSQDVGAALTPLLP